MGLILALDRTASQYLLFKDPDAACRRPDGQRACTGLEEFLAQLMDKDRRRAVPWLFPQSLCHGIFQNRQPSLKAFSESILLFLPGLEDEAQNRQRVSRQKQATPTGFETLGFHSISTSICPTATFSLQGQLLSSRYNLCWMQKDGADTGKLHSGFHQTHAP